MPAEPLREDLRRLARAHERARVDVVERHVVPGEPGHHLGEEEAALRLGQRHAIGGAPVDERGPEAVAQQKRGVTTWHYSLDFNEKCANVEYLLDFIARVKERSPQAFERAQYIEQPTHRDLKAHPENKMHAVAKIKPVVIDAPKWWAVSANSTAVTTSSTIGSMPIAL